MIPGPIEISPTVQQAYSVPPPGHRSEELKEAFGASIEALREVFRSSADTQPFIVSGSGTVAMEMAVMNLVEPGDSVMVIDTGFFSKRMIGILERAGAKVAVLEAEVGRAPDPDEVENFMDRGDYKIVFATHVDTSTAVLLDPEPVAKAARARGILSVFDGVCAAVGEVFRMEEWGADLYLTASQKAIGCPPGLGLMAVGPRALAARRNRSRPPAASFVDWENWLGVHEAYEKRLPSYYATPATNLIMALSASLNEIRGAGLDTIWRQHARVAEALRAAWASLGFTWIPQTGFEASTLSALIVPQGVRVSKLTERIARRGVIVAGGIHPQYRERSFRVGHMGWAISQAPLLERTIRAIALALQDEGHSVDAEIAVAAFRDGRTS